MASPRKTATTTAVASLLESVARETREAALARWTAPPDVFVWRARRCAEAVLYCVLAREGANVGELAKQRKGLDHLLEHKLLEGAFSRETRAQLTTLREFGNIAAHYQLEGGVSAESADGVARLLAGLLREFYALDGSAVPEAQRSYLAALTDASSRVLTPGEQEVFAARRELDEVTRQLHAARAAHEASAPSPQPGSRRHGRLAAAAIALAGFGFAVGRVTTGPSLSLATAHLEGPPLAPAPPPTPVVLNPVPPRAPAPVEPPAPVTAPSTPLAPTPPPRATPLRCDVGMIRVERDGAAFCMDRAPVLTGAYRRFVEADAGTRPSHGDGCNWQNAADDLAVNCVTYPQALAYCRWRHPERGSLPTRAEWTEVRRRAGGTQLPPNTNEWASQTLDGAAVVRGARTATDFAWAQVPPARGDRSVSFRCVVR